MARVPIALLTAAILATTAGCGSDPSGPAREIETAAPQNAIDGAWRLAPSTVLAEDSTEFDVLVYDPVCSGGRKPEVYPPEIQYTDEAVVVTFKIDPRPPGYGACIEGEGVPYTVELDEPVGPRIVVDGAQQ